MPNFKINFIRKVTQYHSAIVEAVDADTAEQMYEDGEIETVVDGEECSDEWGFKAVETDEEPAKPAPSPPSRQANPDFIHDLMSFGNPIKQLIIMESIRRYAEQIATDFDPDVQKGGIWNMMNPHAWKVAAEDIHTAMQERLK